MIRFTSTLTTIDAWTILVLPKSASEKLPSRGMAMAEGTFNGLPFRAPLEPDGKGSHWFRVDEAVMRAAGAGVGDTVTIAIEPAAAWPEPDVPPDLQSALAGDGPARERWSAVTTKARWDWIRWIRSTQNAETRAIRIEKARSKLTSGERNPCCFNRTLCTEPAVSKSGVLHDTTQTASTPPEEEK
ncbi:MAG: YdeI/OmpD-associated family protein [Spirochaetales bacterium]|nr:YdeI/OmpD-associated family protein [Spirochaetales bacterium]